MQFIFSIGNILVDAIKVVIVLGFLIFIHELGHFLVAKKVGIKVHEFALGFGKRLWSFTRGETVYAIRLIPLGGFVKMEGEEEQSEDERAFNKKSILQRMAVVFAGPLMNIAVAVLVFFLLGLAVGGYISNDIETVEPASDAAAKGLKSGDTIIKLNGQTIHIRDELNWLMRENKGEPINLTVLRGNEQKEFTIKPFTMLNFSLAKTYQDKAKSINLNSDNQNIINDIEPNSGLEDLGLKKGYKILSIDGIVIYSEDQVREILGNEKKNKIPVKIEKNGKVEDKEFELSFLKRSIIGFTNKPVMDNFAGLIYNSYWRCIFVTKTTIVETAKLFVGKYSIDQMMGPVGIASQISKTAALIDLLNLAGYISLGLGIANLIPFPPLDGGKILTLCIEAIRRRPLKPEREAAISVVGFTILIMLMLVVMYNDILRMLG